MAAQSGNNKLALGMAISVLVHGCAFFALVLLLQFHASTPQERKMDNLEVRLMPSLLPKTPTEPGKKLLTTRAPAPFAVAQTTVHVEQPPAPTTAVQGVALPGAVAMPGPNSASNSLFHTRPFRQDIARADYQQAMEAQARQRSEQQAQFMMLQLQQLLAKLMDAHPVETGKCLLAESDGGVNHKMSCDSPALYEVLSKDEKVVAEILIALRGMGRMLNGFSAEMRAEKLGVTLLYDGTTKNLDSEPTGEASHY